MLWNEEGATPVWKYSRLFFSFPTQTNIHYRLGPLPCTSLPPSPLIQVAAHSHTNVVEHEYQNGAVIRVSPTERYRRHLNGERAATDGRQRYRRKRTRHSNAPQSVYTIHRHRRVRSKYVSTYRHWPSSSSSCDARPARSVVFPAIPQNRQSPAPPLLLLLLLLLAARNSGRSSFVRLANCSRPIPRYLIIERDK